MAALVTTHGAGRTGSAKWRSAGLTFVAKAIAIDLGCFFSTHIDIVVAPRRRKKARLRAG